MEVAAMPICEPGEYLPIVSGRYPTREEVADAVRRGAECDEARDERAAIIGEG